MPAQFKQVINSFLTWSTYKEFAMSATWHYFPGVGTGRITAKDRNSASVPSE
jgi:hypothetical protein